MIGRAGHHVVIAGLALTLRRVPDVHIYKAIWPESYGPKSEASADVTLGSGGHFRRLFLSADSGFPMQTSHTFSASTFSLDIFQQ